MKQPNIVRMACLGSAAVMLSALRSVSGEEDGRYVEHELVKVTGQHVTFVRRLPLGEGDGKVSVEVVAQINPKTELKQQPGGWWYYLEFQGEDGGYLTGAYKGPTLTAEPKMFRELSSYIPAGTRHVRIGSPDDVPGIPDELRSPMYATSVGLLLWAIDHQGASQEVNHLNNHDSEEEPSRGVSRFFKKMFPR